MITDLFKKEKAVDRVRDFIMERMIATNAEINEYMRGHTGQLSWRTRISDIRKEIELKGGRLDCLPVDARHGLYVYKVVYPQSCTAGV